MSDRVRVFATLYDNIWSAGDSQSKLYILSHHITNVYQPNHGNYSICECIIMIYYIFFLR